MAITQTKFQTIRKSMLANACFSTFTGLLAAGPTIWFADLIGTPYIGLLKLFGISLLLHAIILIIVAKSPKRRIWAKLNFLIIAPYPALMILVIGFEIVSTATGITIVLVDGLVVGLIAIWQYRAIR